MSLFKRPRGNGPEARRPTETGPPDASHVMPRHQAHTPKFVTERPTRTPAPPTAATTAAEEERAFAPHCDARILHQPHECWACDLYPDWQELRVKWGIAFTGHEPKDKVFRANQRAEPVLVRRMLPCPADYNRPPDSPSDHRQWGPNMAQGSNRG